MMESPRDERSLNLSHRITHMGKILSYLDRLKPLFLKHVT
ncbi:Uncharacterised protein [Klebsiella pneumoniae]|nr:Uncharacterised protein [Klebsiella pneumoniae]